MLFIVSFFLMNFGLLFQNHRDIAHPINSQIRNKIQTMVLEKYEDALKEESSEKDDIQ